MKTALRLPLALLFCVVLCLCLVPSVSAESGTWGNLSWILDNDGLLTISGEGAMKDINWSGSSTDAWNQMRNDIITVHIIEGVTSIGNYAFYNCKNLTHVSIPNSVTNIGGNSFANCESLTNVAIPSSVKTIDSYAFVGCITLEAITIPYSVKSIGSYAFCRCNSLDHVIIQDGVNRIESSAFTNCSSLEHVIIPDSVEYLGSSVFNGCTSLLSVNISNGLKDIGNFTFQDCSSLISVTIPDNVTCIGMNCFYGCTNLKSVTIPENIEYILTWAFARCDNIEDVYYSGSEEQWAQICASCISYGNTCLTDATIHFPGSGSNPPFDLNFDAWSFENDGSVFNPPGVFSFLSHYYISDSDFQRLLSSASNVEKELLRKQRDKIWDGSCYGMSVTAILVKMGVLSPSDFESGKACLHDVSNPDDDNIESLINYYHFQQFMALSQFVRGGFIDLSDREKLEIVENLGKEASATGNPFLLNISGKKKGHAVVGYGFEQGTYIINNTAYDRRILIYDPNYPEGDENSYLYFNKSSTEWFIPNHNTMNILQGAIDDLYILDQAGHGYTADNCYYVVQYIPALDQEIVVLHFNGKDYQLYLDEDENGSGLGFVQMSDSSEGSSFGYFLIPPGATDYSFETQGGGELEFIAGNVMFNTSTENAAEITVTDDGQMSFTTNGEFTVSSVFNENQCTTPWYKNELSGEAAGEIKMRQEQSGFLLEGDLSEVVFTAANDDSTLELSISTDVDSILVEEVNGELTAFVDTDGDGEYETKLEDIAPIFTIHNSPYKKGSDKAVYASNPERVVYDFKSFALSSSPEDASLSILSLLDYHIQSVTAIDSMGNTISAEHSVYLERTFLDSLAAGTYYLWGIGNDDEKTLIGSFEIQVADDVIAIVNGVECTSVEELNGAIHDADNPVITVIAGRTIPYEPYSGSVYISGHIPWEQTECVVISKDATIDLNGGTVCGVVINGTNLLIKDNTNGVGKVTGVFDLRNVYDFYVVDGRIYSEIRNASLSVTGGSFIPDFNVSQYLAPGYAVESADGWDKVVPVTYTISYDANGGYNAPESQEKIHGTALTLTDAVPSRTGWYFLGWAESPDAVDPDYPRPGGTFMRDADTILYAVWAQPDLVLPADITEICAEAFAGGSFRFAMLPEHAVLIGSHAFADCRNLKYIFIHDKVTEIADDAFGNIKGMTIFGGGSYLGVKTTAETYAEAHGFTFVPVYWRIPVYVPPQTPIIIE